MPHEAPEMLGLRERTLYTRRGDLEGAVVPFGFECRRDGGDDPRAELVVHRTVLPVHKQRQHRPRREAGLHQLGPFRERAFHNLRQSFQSRRLYHLLQTLKKATGPWRPLALVQHRRLYRRVCRLQGALARVATAPYTPVATSCAATWVGRTRARTYALSWMWTS